MKTLLAVVFSAALLLAAGYGIKAGKYEGEWQGSQSGGPMSVVFEGGGDDAPVTGAKVTVIVDGAEAPTTVREFKTAGNSVEIAYDADAGGMELLVRMKGALEEKKVKGTYTVASRADNSHVDDGTWWVERKD